MKTTNNKLLIIIGVLVIILLGLGSAAVVAVIAHASSSSASTTNLTPTVTASTSPTSTTKAKARRVTGVIQSINGQSIVIAPSKGAKKPVTIMLTSTTKYKTSTGKASLSDLKVGETVQVNATLDAQTGELDATRVTIQSASATPTATP